MYSKRGGREEEMDENSRSYDKIIEKETEIKKNNEIIRRRIGRIMKEREMTRN